MGAEWLSRLGRWIGDLNDRTSSHDSRYYAGVRWRIVDRFAGWLYTLPDRQRARPPRPRRGPMPDHNAPERIWAIVDDAGHLVDTAASDTEASELSENYDRGFGPYDAVEYIRADLAARPTASDLTHPERVAAAVPSDCRVVALLHDAIEGEHAD